MAPIRRYLRISHYTTLEVRIHLENPSDAHRWLLKQNDPALPRVMEAVRPLIVPKLREARANDRKTGKKKEIIKDVVQRDEFNVTIYYRPLMTPHSVVKRHKTFASKAPQGEFTGTQDEPLQVDDNGDSPQLQREESEENDVVKMEDIPTFDSTTNVSGTSAETATRVPDGGEPQSQDDQSAATNLQGEAETEDKKKMGMIATYEGFRVDDHVLTLLVTRKDGKGKETDAGVGHAMMEEWITSTQVAATTTDD